ncbi:MAG: hypothetical protein QNJ92_11550 [Alphaproteobacteria bacterium]|nr:hypothetical protein [Alphaproteobacteria bacterium]
MRTRALLALCSALISLAGVPSVVHAQSVGDRTVTCPSPAKSGKPTLRRWWDKASTVKNVQHLQSQVAELESRLEHLKRKQNSLPSAIESQESLVSLLKRGPTFAKFPKVNYQDRERPWLPAELKATWGWPLIIHDVVERYIPLYEEALAKQYPGKKIEYDMEDLWDWIVPREEAELTELERQLDALPLSIATTQRYLNEKKAALSAELRGLSVVCPKASDGQPKVQSAQKTKRVCSGGGLVGGMNCVEQRIDGGD